MGEDANPLSQRARIEQAINDGLDEAAVLPTFQLRVLTVQLVANRIESLPAAPRVREPAGNHSGNSEDRNRMSRSTSQPSLRSAIENAVVHGLAEAALWSATPEQRALVVQLVTDRVERLPSTFPDPAGGCVCGSYSEDRGGGYHETLQEYDPACPVHSVHVYNPRTGVWVDAESPRAAWRPETCRECGDRRGWRIEPNPADGEPMQVQCRTCAERHDAEVRATALEDFAAERYEVYLEDASIPWPDQPSRLAQQYARSAYELRARARAERGEA